MGIARLLRTIFIGEDLGRANYGFEVVYLAIFNGLKIFQYLLAPLKVLLRYSTLASDSNE